MSFLSCQSFTLSPLPCVLGELGLTFPFLDRYGALLEKFREQDSSVIGKIKGCIVDSAPVAAPDPQVKKSF